ncbi:MULTISPECIES: tetratricopeptide repeat protein [unclassified Campylobacter]|uniref:tetratricopeptide repeat protein n=1 Tax=unclassified Campylobacter TaxID=2593542 RepID=UPI001237E635|nr:MULTISPECIES: tetratricopeptide repeat protein [unclassified Campylobacter]KAA6224614.1 hypothetical protein FMM54_08170 [Campylobacter sp. LR185c]KAA6224856.1 hypothetical protein FMM57_08445 [Campylobacter sp. LR286c]KAA6228003.1 hypothetical protein FMM55_02215 [Campylobacter sp. LR196d]KAA6234421.1 hypothetical protein FMM56_00845 [Campylobacter sp. LR264d]KAA8603522.1 hypothetical protein CGP82_06745 [Campylobacter sp. LR185c]
MKKTFLVALCGATFLYAETSAFGAGVASSSTPYGLNANEKYFKEKIDFLSDNYSQINAKINETNERLEGLQSTLEGINSQYAKSTSRLAQLENSYDDNNLSNELAALKAYVEESRTIQEKNNKQIKTILIELSSLVDSINDNYVSKNEIDRNLSSASALLTPSVKNEEKKPDVKEETKKVTEKKVDDSWKKKQNNEILELALSEFNKNSLESAGEKFQYLVSKQYRPATANFYLGEIQYKKKNYASAFNYYKISTSHGGKKSDYYPKLLYHTAISLDKVGDTASANKFYKALKQEFPNSAEAKAAPNRK